MKPINVGLLGIGTVGGGTWTVLTRNQEEITRRAGRPIQITAVADRDVERAKSMTGGAARVTGDAFEVVRDPSIDIVVELIGGYTVAKQLVLEAIANGKHVVTANKALLAVHGQEIFAAAQAKGVMVAFEAAVAGGIPIIKAVREGLTANRIDWIRRHHQRHHQLHPVGNARQGPYLCRCAGRRTAPGLCRSRSDLRHRRRRCRSQDHAAVRRWPSASRCSSSVPTSRASQS